MSTIEEITSQALIGRRLKKKPSKNAIGQRVSGDTGWPMVQAPARCLLGQVTSLSLTRSRRPTG